MQPTPDISCSRLLKTTTGLACFIFRFLRRPLLAQGRTAGEVAELLGVHRATLYRALRSQETSRADAARRGAFIEDALTEGDALVAAGEDEHQEERA